MIHLMSFPYFIPVLLFLIALVTLAIVFGKDREKANIIESIENTSGSITKVLKLSRAWFPTPFEISIQKNENYLHSLWLGFSVPVLHLPGRLLRAIVHVMALFAVAVYALIVYTIMIPVTAVRYLGAGATGNLIGLKMPTDLTTVIENARCEIAANIAKREAESKAASQPLTEGKVQVNLPASSAN